MPLEIINCEQNTPEWLDARRGIITASAMGDLMAKGQGKTRQTYMAKLISERATGLCADNYVGADMERGKENEPYARARYEQVTGNPVEIVGFCRNHQDIGTVGYSPDGFVGEDGLVEFKDRARHVQVKHLLDIEPIPLKDMYQVQTGLWVTGRKWCDYVCYNEYLPPRIRRITPDKDMISAMRDQSRIFNYEVEKGTDKILGMIAECMAPIPHDDEDIIDDFISGRSEPREYRA